MRKPVVPRNTSSVTASYGLAVDYLAEALRELRRHNYTEMVDRYFALGAHLNARDVKAVRSLTEPHQVGMDNGARRALIPLENKRNFLEVSGDIMERGDPIVFSDPMTAAMKALGMNGNHWKKLLGRHGRS